MNDTSELLAWTDAEPVHGVFVPGRCAYQDFYVIFDAIASYQRGFRVGCVRNLNRFTMREIVAKPHRFAVVPPHCRSVGFFWTSSNEIFNVTGESAIHPNDQRSKENQASSAQCTREVSGCVFSVLARDGKVAHLPAYSEYLSVRGSLLNHVSRTFKLSQYHGLM